MKSIKTRVAALLALAVVALGARADDAVRALIHISPQQYAHETMLRHHYIHYWFSQGEVLEPIALESLKPILGESAMCSGNKKADVVVMLTPHMFYSPYASIFYGKITARVFSGNGKQVATYKAKIEHWGSLDVLPEEQIKTTYRAAMDDVVRQMQADASLQSLLAQGLPESETRMPCAMMAVLPPEKNRTEKKQD